MTLTAIPLESLDLSLLRAIAHGGGRLEEAISDVLSYWRLVENKLLDAPLPVLRHVSADGRVSYVPAHIEVALTGYDISSYAEVEALLALKQLQKARPDLLRAMSTYRCDTCRDVISLARTWDLAALHLLHGTPGGLCLACATKAVAAQKAAA